MSESRYRKIVVRAPNWVGDAVMSLPFFASLRLNAPDSEIVILARPYLRPIFGNATGVSEVIDLDESRGIRGWRFLLENASKLRYRRFDLGLCLPPSFGSALMFQLAGVKRRIGHASEGRRLLLTASLPYPRRGQRGHRAEGYLSLLRLAWPDAPQIDRRLFLPHDQPARDQVDLLWQQLGLDQFSSVLSVAPGASRPNRMWSPSRYSELVSRWLEFDDHAVLVVGGTADKPICAQVTAHSGRCLNLAGAGDLAFTAEVIRRCQFFVGNDSGLSHLAAAVGVRTIVIFGNADPAEVAPFSPLATVVRKPLFCSPCSRNDCWRKDHPLECLDLVSVDDVWQKLVPSPGDVGLTTANIPSRFGTNQS